MVVFAIASFGCTLPHFIFGDQLLHANIALHSGGSNSLSNIIVGDAGAAFTEGQTRDDHNLNLCRISNNNSTDSNSKITFIVTFVRLERNNKLLNIFYSVRGENLDRTGSSCTNEKNCPRHIFTEFIVCGHWTNGRFNAGYSVY